MPTRNARTLTKGEVDVVLDRLLAALTAHDMDGFSDCFAPAATIEFPFAAPGYPERLVGQDASPSTPTATPLTTRSPGDAASTRPSPPRRPRSSTPDPRPSPRSDTPPRFRRDAVASDHQGRTAAPHQEGRTQWPLAL